MLYKRTLCWLRRDIRISDHHAMYKALSESENVAIVFIYDTLIIDKINNRMDRRITFIHDSLLELDKKLRSNGSALITVYGNPCLEIPLLSKRLSVNAVYCNRDYEPYAKKRDNSICKNLKSMGVSFHTFKDQVIFESLEVTTKTKQAYRKYTPYKNAWINKLTKNDLNIFKPNLNNLIPINELGGTHNFLPLKNIGFVKSKLPLEPGETSAIKTFNSFLKAIDNYKTARDIPSVKGTSGLSVHLRFGTISIRSLIRAIYKNFSHGAKTWLSELIWREFYQMILDRNPHVIDQNFLPKFNQIKWPGKIEHFEAWKEAKTGYPLIDAAMRHFNETGLMHNRLRMVTASFLVKDLLLDWRKGEYYFAQNLLDYDLAANNGGWQWCASTGCDSQPWFRIFNPITQSKRFDSDGIFIRKNIPEICGFSNIDIHYPSTTSRNTQNKVRCLIGKDYPNPIVDHSIQRIKALKIFSNCTNN